MGSGFIKNILIPAWTDSREVTHVHKTDFAGGLRKNISGEELSLQDTRPPVTKKVARVIQPDKGLKGCK